MHEIEVKLRDICEMKEKLTSWTKEELEKGKECVNTSEMSQAVDMIKDLADAEKNCWKAYYYKTVIDAMEGEFDEDDGGMYGYDNWRYSSGRFAPTGRGHYAGYTGDRRDRMRNPGTVYSQNDSYGYPNGNGNGNGNQGNGSGGNGSSGYPMNPNGGIYGIDDLKGYPTMPPMHRSQTGSTITSRYGYPYDEWNDARRNYTESHSDADKKMMEHKAMEHATCAAESVKHIWKEADPQLKEKLKKELKPLLEMLNKEST